MLDMNEAILDFQTVDLRKQPRCPSTEEWMKKVWYIHAVVYYSATEATNSCHL